MNVWMNKMATALTVMAVIAFAGISVCSDYSSADDPVSFDTIGFEEAMGYPLIGHEPVFGIWATLSFEDDDVGEIYMEVVWNDGTKNLTDEDVFEADKTYTATFSFETEDYIPTNDAYAEIEFNGNPDPDPVMADVSTTANGFSFTVQNLESIPVPLPTFDYLVLSGDLYYPTPGGQPVFEANATISLEDNYVDEICLSIVWNDGTKNLTNEDVFQRSTTYTATFVYNGGAYIPTNDATAHIVLVGNDDFDPVDADIEATAEGFTFCVDDLEIPAPAPVSFANLTVMSIIDYPLPGATPVYTAQTYLANGEDAVALINLAINWNDGSKDLSGNDVFESGKTYTATFSYTGTAYYPAQGAISEVVLYSTTVDRSPTFNPPLRTDVGCFYFTVGGLTTSTVTPEIEFTGIVSSGQLLNYESRNARVEGESYTGRNDRLYTTQACTINDMVMAPFTIGESYYLKLDVMISGTPGAVLNSYALVNGQQVSIVDDPIIGGLVKCVILPVTIQRETIDYIELATDYPTHNKQSGNTEYDWSEVSSSDITYSDIVRSWWNGQSQLQDSDRFVANNTYTVKFEIPLRESSTKVFNPNIVVKIGDNFVESHQVTVPAQNVSVSNDGRTLTVTYDLDTPRMNITRVVVHFDNPLIGDSPAENPITIWDHQPANNDGVVTVSSSAWQIDGTFQPNTEYRVNMILTAGQYYQFTANTAVHCNGYTEQDRITFDYQTGEAFATYTTPSPDAFSGLVKDSSDQPIAGARVEYYVVTASYDSNLGYVMTGQDGRFYIDATDHQRFPYCSTGAIYIFNIIKDGYVQASPENVTNWNGATYEIPAVTMQVSQTKVITIKDVNQQPVQGVNVYFSWGDGDENETYGITDASGVATLQVGAQTGNLMLSKAGYAIFNSEVAAGDIQHTLLAEDDNNVKVITLLANNNTNEYLRFCYESGSTVIDLSPLVVALPSPYFFCEYDGYTIDAERCNTESDGSGTYRTYLEPFVINSSINYYVMWNANYANVHLYNGYDPEDQGITRTMYVGDNLPIFNTLGITYTGHDFTTWNTDANGRGTPYPNFANIDELIVAPGVNVSLYAQWRNSTYDVTLNTNGGTINSGNVTSYTYGTGATLPTDVTKDNVRFAGWYANPNFGGNRITSIVADDTGNKEYWAKWVTTSIESFVVGNDQFAISDADITYTYPAGADVTALVPTITVSDGCVVSPANGIAQDFTQPVTYRVSLSDDAQTYVDYTVTVKVREATPDCGVVLVSRGAGDDANFIYNGTLSREFSRVLYSVDGGNNWSAVSNDGTVLGITAVNGLQLKKAATAGNKADSEIQTFNFETVSVASQLQLTVEGMNMVLTGGNVSMTFSTSTGYHLPDSISVTKDSQAFQAFTYNQNNGVFTVNGLDGDLQVTVAPAANRYTVTFDKNNENATGQMADQDFVYGTAQALTANAFERDGYGMIGWSTAPNGDVVYTNGQSVKDLATEDDSNVTLYAQWAQCFTITYDANNGTGAPVDATQYSYNGTEEATVLGPANMNRTGYVFQGWNTQADGQGTSYVQGNKIVMNANKTLYAQWSPINYIIQFVGGEGTTGTMAVQTMSYDVAANLTANAFQKTGYTFVRWNGPNQTQYTDGQNVCNLADQQGATIVLNAEWTINYATVTFKNGYDQGDQGVTMTVNYGSPLPAFSTLDISYIGHDFNAWFGSQGNVFADQANIDSMITAPGVVIILHASWNNSVYDVTLNTNGGTINSGNVVSYIYGSGATLPTDVTKDNVMFAGWYANPNFGGNRITSIAADDTGNKDYWAKWTSISLNSFTVVNDVFEIDGTAISHVYPAGTDVTALVPTITVSDGCVVSPASGVAQDFTQPVTYRVSLSDDAQTYVDYTVTVKVREATPNCTLVINTVSTVTLDGDYAGLKYSVNGGNSWADVPNNGEIQNIVAADGLKLKKEASAANMADSEIQSFVFWTVTVAEDAHLQTNMVTLIQDDGNMILNLNTSEGYHLPDQVQVKKGEVDFAGTAYDKSAGTLTLSGIDGNLVATIVTAANTYTVTFDKNNENATGQMAAQDFTYDVSQALSANAFQRDGWGMVGWSATAVGEVVYTNGATVSNLSAEDGATVTLYAQWAQCFTLTYDANGGTGAPVDSNQYSYTGQDQATILDKGNMALTGYRFTGWNSQADGQGTSYAAGDSITMNASKTLYAKWSPISYSIEFVGGEGATGTMANQSMTYGTAANLTANMFQKTGYTFDRWNGPDDTQYDDGANVNNLAVQDGAKIVLNAQWAPITYQVVFHKNDGSSTVENRVATYDVAFTNFANPFNYDGYEFVWWNTQANGGGVNYVADSSVTNLASDQGAQVHMYAVWSFVATAEENTSTGSVDFATDTSSTSVSIDAAGVESAKNSIQNNDAIDKVVVKSSDWTVDIPSAALNHIASTNVPITLSVAAMDNAAVPEAVKAKTGDMQVISLNMMVNNAAYTDNFGDMLTITIPYVLKDGETAENLYIWTFNEATGQLSERTKVTYDAVEQAATFQVAHFSFWALGAFTEPSGGEEFPILIVAIAAVAILAVAGIAVYFLVLKKKA